MISVRNLYQYLYFLFLIVSGVSCSGVPQSFDELLESIGDSKPEERSEMLTKYRLLQSKFPVISDTTVHFLFRSDSQENIFLTGDMCFWKPDSLQMKNIEGTNYYYYSMTFPGDARIEYKFVESRKAVNDPLNPFTDGGPLGQNSVLFMPRYMFPQEILLKKENLVSAIDTIEFKSKILNNVRTILVYKPVVNEQINKLVLMNDGQQYLEYANAQIIMDNLIAEKKIPPVYGIFIPPVDRMKEYWLNENYVDMIMKELIPFLESRYRFGSQLSIGMGGASLGGVISLYALTKYPDKLDFVFSQSGSLQISDRAISQAFSSLKGSRTKIYLGYGKFEGTENEHLEIEKHFIAKNLDYTLRKINEGHNWGNWRGHLPDALKFGLSDGEIKQ